MFATVEESKLPKTTVASEMVWIKWFLERPCSFPIHHVILMKS